ncbi:MAG: hypothetical protein H6Q65_2272 [Firmicutes bacterium]|nr:hypothetical protein [Bacillota bacterium]
MFTTKVGDNNLSVTFDETVQKELKNNFVSPAEIYKLVLNFAGSLLAVKKDEEFYIANEETGASMVLNMKWTSEHDVTVHVMKTTNIIDEKNKHIDLTPKTAESVANQQ